MGTHTTHRRARTGLIAAALLLGAAVTACSDDSSDGAKDTTTTSTTVAGSSTTVAADQGQPIEGFGDYTSQNYDGAAHWLCRPDKAADVCGQDLDATQVDADGTLTPQPFEAAVDPPIDCFYVYPTISQDQTPTSDWTPSPDEEEYVTLNQAARLGSQCRVFAPVYRQFTLAALVGRTSGTGGPKGETADPYADVLDAFKTYLAQDNHGRGFVLIGHSQGSSLLGQLLREEIDGNEPLRSHLVAAYLPGSSVAVPEGKDVGGDLQNIPLCRKTDQTGCVLSWATFRSTAPPTAASFFGRPSSRTGNDTGPGMVSACVNPADLAGTSTGDGVALDSSFPADAKGSILTPSNGDSSWLEGAGAEKITTPFVTVPGLVTGRCASKDGFNFLSITVHPDPGPRLDDVPGDLTPQWGMHLIDVNVVMGDIVALVGEQAKAYTG